VDEVRAVIVALAFCGTSGIGCSSRFEVASGLKRTFALLVVQAEGDNAGTNGASGTRTPRVFVELGTSGEGISTGRDNSASRRVGIEVTIRNRETLAIRVFLTNGDIAFSSYGVTMNVSVIVGSNWRVTEESSESSTDLVGLFGSGRDVIKTLSSAGRGSTITRNVAKRCGGRATIVVAQTIRDDTLTCKRICDQCHAKRSSETGTSALRIVMCKVCAILVGFTRAEAGGSDRVANLICGVAKYERSDACAVRISVTRGLNQRSSLGV